MRRTTWIAALAVLGCSGVDKVNGAALSVHVLISPRVPATCVTLQRLPTSGEPLQQVRSTTDVEQTFSIDQGELPDEVELQAVAQVGTGCDALRLTTGRSTSLTASFIPGELRRVDLTVYGPPSERDADGDGYPSSGDDGALDCDDQDARRNPGNVEQCLGVIDADCDGKIGCADPDCDGVACSNPPRAIRFASAPRVGGAGQCLGPLKVEARDDLGAPAPLRAMAELRFSTTPASALTFYADPLCSATLPVPLPLEVGQTEVSLYVRGSTAGAVSVTADAGAALGTTSQFVTVQPVLRAGRCTLAPGMAEVTCPLDAPKVEPSRTVLFFQALTSDGRAGGANVRCGLIPGGESIGCTRGGGTTAVTVVWQLTQFAQGVHVQHLQPKCSGVSSTTVTLPQAVQAVTRTFVLASSDAPGDAQGGGAFRTVALTDASHVVIQSNGACDARSTFGLQVVEMAGAQVLHGRSTGMDHGTLDVPGLAAADVARSFLLYGWRTSIEDAAICDRMLRGALTGPTSIQFARGDNTVNCGQGLVDEITWQRVTLPAGFRVQHLDTRLAAGEGSRSFPVLSAVDPSRTVVFSGGQWAGGQGSGEGSFAGGSVIGEMIGGHTLLDATHLKVERGSTAGAARWGSYVVELQPGSGEP